MNLVKREGKQNKTQVQLLGNSGKSSFVILIIIFFIGFFASLGWLYSTRQNETQLPESLRRPLEFPRGVIESNQLKKEIAELELRIEHIREQWRSGETSRSLLRQLESFKENINSLKEETSGEELQRFKKMLNHTEELMHNVRNSLSTVGENFDNVSQDIDELRSKISPDNKETTDTEELKNEDDNATE